MWGWKRPSVSISGTVGTLHNSWSILSMWGRRVKRKNPDKNMPYYLVICFPIVLHFLWYSDLSYWFQHTLYSQIHHPSSITLAGPSFYSPPHEELICLVICLEDGQNQRWFVWDQFRQPLPITDESMKAREELNLPRSHSTLVAEVTSLARIPVQAPFHDGTCQHHSDPTKQDGLYMLTIQAHLNKLCIV